MTHGRKPSQKAALGVVFCSTRRGMKLPVRHGSVRMIAMTQTQIVNIERTPEEEIDKYIDRRSKYGSQFKLEKDGGDYTREESVATYRDWFYADAQADLRQQAREELTGKTLGCWCKPKACHGDVIVEFLESDGR